MGDTGLEPKNASLCSQTPYVKPPTPADAESDVIADGLPILNESEDALESTLPSDIRFVVNQWPNLPEATQRAILAIVRAAGGQADQGKTAAITSQIGNN